MCGYLNCVLLIVLCFSTITTGKILCSRRVYAWREAQINCLNAGGEPVGNNDLDWLLLNQLNLPEYANLWTADYSYVFERNTSLATEEEEIARCGYVKVDYGYRFSGTKYDSCRDIRYFICRSDKSTRYSGNDPVYKTYAGTWNDASECAVTVNVQIMKDIQAPFGNYWTRNVLHAYSLEKPYLSVPSPYECGYHNPEYWRIHTVSLLTTNCSQRLHTLCDLRYTGGFDMDDCDKVTVTTPTTTIAHTAVSTASNTSTSTTASTKTSTSTQSTVSTTTPFNQSTLLYSSTTFTEEHVTTTAIDSGTNDDNNKSMSKDKNDTGVIVGVSVGVSTVVILLIIIGFLVIRRKGCFKSQSSKKHHGDKSTVSTSGHSNIAYGVENIDGNEYDDISYSKFQSTDKDNVQNEQAEYAKVAKRNAIKAINGRIENGGTQLIDDTYNAYLVPVNQTVPICNPGYDGDVENMYANVSNDGDADTVYETYECDNDNGGTHGIVATNRNSETIPPDACDTRISNDVNELDTDFDSDVDCFSSDTDSYASRGDATYYSYSERDVHCNERGDIHTKPSGIYAEGLGNDTKCNTRLSKPTITLDTEDTVCHFYHQLAPENKTNELYSNA